MQNQKSTKSTCVGVGDIFLSARGLPSLATRSRPLHAWWVSILHSVIGCQGVAAIAAGWLVDGYPIWCKGKSETGGERAEVIGRAMLKRGARKLGSGQVRRYLASMYLWGRPRPACQKGQSATELLAETISPLPPTHTNLHRVRGPTGRQAARLLVSRPASFPIGVFATRLHLNGTLYGSCGFFFSLQCDVACKGRVVLLYTVLYQYKLLFDYVLLVGGCNERGLIVEFNPASHHPPCLS